MAMPAALLLCAIAEPVDAFSSLIGTAAQCRHRITVTTQRIASEFCLAVY